MTEEAEPVSAAGCFLLIFQRVLSRKHSVLRVHDAHFMLAEVTPVTQKYAYHNSKNNF